MNLVQSINDFYSSIKDLYALDKDIFKKITAEPKKSLETKNEGVLVFLGAIPTYLKIITDRAAQVYRTEYVRENPQLAEKIKSLYDSASFMLKGIEVWKKNLLKNLNDSKKEDNIDDKTLNFVLKSIDKLFTTWYGQLMIDPAGYIVSQKINFIIWTLTHASDSLYKTLQFFKMIEDSENVDLPALDGKQQKQLSEDLIRLNKLAGTIK
jgi:hypothetical protein